MMEPHEEQRPPLDDIGNPQARLDEVLWRVERWSAAVLRPMLLERLRDPYPPIRRAAAAALSKRMDPELADTLRELARDEAGELVVRRAAAVALRGAPGDATLEILVALASAQDADLRYQALTSLFALEAPAALMEPLARRALADEDQEISGAAAQIAAALKLTSAVPALIRAHERLLWANRLHVTLALCELAPALDAPARASLPEAALVQDLGRALRDTTCAGAAAHALMALSPAVAREQLTKTLGRWLIHPLIKVEIAGVLAGAGEPAGEQYLLDALSSRKREVRGWAVELVGRYAVASGAGRLERLVHEDGTNARAALGALARLPDAEERLKRLETTIKDTQLAARARRLRHKLARDATL